jgi:hypothetical protein
MAPKKKSISAKPLAVLSSFIWSVFNYICNYCQLFDWDEADPISTRHYDIKRISEGMYFFKILNDVGTGRKLIRTISSLN